MEKKENSDKQIEIEQQKDDNAKDTETKDDGQENIYPKVKTHKSKRSKNKSKDRKRKDKSKEKKPKDKSSERKPKDKSKERKPKDKLKEKKPKDKLKDSKSKVKSKNKMKNEKLPPPQLKSVDGSKKNQITSNKENVQGEQILNKFKYRYADVPPEKRPIYVVMDFKGMLHEDCVSEPNLTIQIIGMELNRPILQLGNEVYTGEIRKYDGTVMCFYKDRNYSKIDQVFCKAPRDRVNLGWLCKFCIRMKRVLIDVSSEEDDEDDNPDNTDKNKVKIRKKKEPPKLDVSGTYQEALERMYIGFHTNIGGEVPVTRT